MCSREGDRAACFALERGVYAIKVTIVIHPAVLLPIVAAVKALIGWFK
jgi:hypothetical protein